MNNMDSNTISEILVVILGIMSFVLMILVITFIILKSKQKSKNKIKNSEIVFDKKSDKSKNEGEKKQVNTQYSKESIMNFIEFDKIEDNMIVQKKGKRYLMVVECQGVNYDLMSKMEKTSVEEGFQQFLNTLRHPIQIYIQTRTVNLEQSIIKYKERVKIEEDKYNKMVYEYRRAKESGAYSEQDIEKFIFEITRQKNLLEYSKDIVANTEKMSLNRNILNKRYYIIVPYFSEESIDEKYDLKEIQNMAFSELYTKAQSIIRTLTACSITGKILSSEELIDLLYVAYNRDDSEIFGIDKAIKSGYNNLYSISQDVYEKKIKALDEEINRRAMDLANRNIEQAKSELQRKAENKEANLEDLVKKMAEVILNENKQYIGEDVVIKAIEDLKNEEGGTKENEEVKKTTRGRKKSTIK